MESVLPQAAAIWIVLLLIVAALAAAGVLLPGRRSATEPENDDASRYAGEIAVAADRAAATAARRRAEWESAAAEVDAAWTAYDDAERAARRLAAASPFPTLRRRLTEDADRQRYLHRAATAACRRREISIGQLNEALAHRGWDPRRHPVAQEVALHEAIRAHRLAAYRAATARECEAWQAAELAAAALRSLRAEATAAQTQSHLPTAEELWWAEQWEATVPIRSTVDSRHPIAA